MPIHLHQKRISFNCEGAASALSPSIYAVSSLARQTPDSIRNATGVSQVRTLSAVRGWIMSPYVAYSIFFTYLHTLIEFYLPARPLNIDQL